MIKVTDFSEAVFDTTIIVKGLLPPRRKKNDSIYKEQLRAHTICNTLLEKVEKRELRMVIPSVALIETATVISRLTNEAKVAEESVAFLRSAASRIVHDSEFLEEAIKVGLETKTSGFDVVFLTCSKMFHIPLITDDQWLTEVAKKYGYNCISIKEING